MFEPGAFSVAKRLTNLVYKGGVFAVIGFFAGVAGTSLSNGLLALRKQVRAALQGSFGSFRTAYRLRCGGTITYSGCAHAGTCFSVYEAPHGPLCYGHAIKPARRPDSA